MEISIRSGAGPTRANAGMRAGADWRSNSPGGASGGVPEAERTDTGPARPEPVPGRVFEVLAKAEKFSSAIHESVRSENAVLDIRDFELWYATKQALHGISMPVSSEDHGAHQAWAAEVDAPPLREPAERPRRRRPVAGDMKLNSDSIYAPGVA
jgi:hypothetical protein